MEEKNKGLKIWLLIFCFIILLLIIYNMFYLLNNSEHNNANKNNNYVPLCVKNVNNLNEIKPISNCITSNITLDKVEIAGVNVKVKAIIKSVDEYSYNLELYLNDTKIEEDYFTNLNKGIANISFKTITENDKVVALVLLANDMAQCRNQYLTIISNSGQILFSAEKVDVTFDDNEFKIVESNYCMPPCEEKDLWEDIYMITKDYQLVNGKVELLATKTDYVKNVCSIDNNE